MNVSFEKDLASSREAILARITEHFRQSALEAHVFGSVAKGKADALSDIDIWITFSDEDAPKQIEKRFETYMQFGEVVLYHEAQQNFPLNGNYSLVLYKTDTGLLQVDFFLAPLSSSRIGDDSKVLFEKTQVERGKMIYDPKRVPKGTGDRVSFILCMCFVGIKKVTRNDTEFLDFLVGEYSKLKEGNLPQLAAIKNENDFETLIKLLDNLSQVSDETQKIAVQVIVEFLKRVEFSK